MLYYKSWELWWTLKEEFRSDKEHRKAIYLEPHLEAHQWRTMSRRSANQQAEKYTLMDSLLEGKLT